MLVDGEDYRPSMVRFLNRFSKHAQQFSKETVAFCEQLFLRFLEASEQLSTSSFHGKTGKKFNLSMFEAIFTAACGKAFAEHSLVVPKIDPQKVEALKSDEAFIDATKSRTADTSIVKARIRKAKEFLMP
jgi:hypothetical protein